MDLEDTKHEKWGLCCSSVYKSEVVFMIQIMFLFTILIFSIVQITLKSDNLEIYFSLISSIIGILVPSPKMNKNE
jgi:FtsH-binding integral membrane protein